MAQTSSTRSTLVALRIVAWVGQGRAISTTCQPRKRVDQGRPSERRRLYPSRSEVLAIRYSQEEEDADRKGEGANKCEQVASDAHGQGAVGKCESMAFGCQDDNGNHDQSQSKDGKWKRQAFGPGHAPGPHIHQIMKESIQCKGDGQAQWS
jgi:hypothetical protein